jgi:hypothetical protein
MAVGYLDAMDAKPRNFNTNWQSHRVKLATMAAFQTGDAKLIDRARAAYRAQVTEPTSSPTARCSTSTSATPALRHLRPGPADDGGPVGPGPRRGLVHLEEPGGASLPGALDWLAPYAKGEKTHIEFANSKIQFDRDRAAAGQKEYAPHPWDVSNAVGTYGLASLLDPRYGGLRDDLSARTGKRRRPGSNCTAGRAGAEGSSDLGVSVATCGRGAAISGYGAQIPG